MIITDKFKLPSLVGDPGGISLDTNIDQRRGRYGDQPLHPPLQILHLKTLEREIQKDLNILIKRGERDIHLLLLLLLPQYHCQVRDYGRYQRSRYSPQAVQNPQVLQKYLLFRQWHLNWPYLALQGIQVPISRLKPVPFTGQSMRFLGLCLRNYAQDLPWSILR